MRRLTEFVLDHPYAVLVAVALLTVLSAAQIVDVRTGTLRLQFDPSSSRLFPTHDEARDYYEHVRRVFGSDEVLVLALVDDGGVFTRENLERVVRLTGRLERIDGVHHVTSLANALNIRSVAEGELEIEPFLAELPVDAEGLARVRREALENPIYAGNLVSRNGDATALIVYLDEMTDAEFQARAIDEQIRTIAREERGDVQLLLTGGSVVKAANTRMGIRDIFRTTPLIGVAMGLVAAFAYRSPRGVLLPLISVGLATLWTLAAVVFSGRPLNIITLAIPALVMTTGFAYAVHVVDVYYEALANARSSGDDARARLREAIGEISLPVAICALTTVVGFVSLAVSPLEGVRELGIFCVVGTVGSFLAAVTVPIAALAVLPLPRRLPGGGGHGRFEAWLQRVAEFDLRHRTWILSIGALLVVLSIWGATRIQVGMDQVGIFRADHPVRLDFEAINERLEGSNVFYVVLEADYRDAFQDPANLAEIENLQAWLGAQPEIGGTTSLVDYVKLINRGFHDNDPAELRIPESQRLVSQLVFFGGNEELEKMVDSSYQLTIVVVRSKVIDSAKVAALIARIEGRLRELPERLEARVTGNSVLVTNMLDSLSAGQASSLMIGFGLIYLLLALLFTSFKTGFLALLPNAFPVLAYYGTLGWTGITLNPTTSLVSCIVLGIAVDDTIHLFSRFNHAARRLADEKKAVVESVTALGRPVTVSTLTLVLGFLVLATSEMRTQVEFGLLAAYTLALSWVAELTLTPCIASLMRIVTLWDVLSLNLGRDPQKTIPLFRGLREAQARVVALMMGIQSHPKGHRLMQTGQSGEDMFVVLDGELRVALPAERGSMEVARLRRGDVVGEVALFSGVRSADVEAMSDVRLLRLTQADLEKLRRRNPRIGAQVLQNLSSILAGRLMQANQRTSGATQLRPAAP